MSFIDIHTHNSAPAPHTIFNSGAGYLAERKISTGIHPWAIGDKWESEFATITKIAKEDNVVAIGECGLDTLKSPATIELQKEIFKAHIRLSELLKKPLIIHCVKAYDILIALRRESAPQQAWIIHGFRGKPEFAEQLVKAGFYISLGEKFNPSSAKAVPTERLFIESDESHSPIAEIYAAVAAAKSSTVEQLAQQIATNARIFKQF